MNRDNNMEKRTYTGNRFVSKRRNGATPNAVSERTPQQRQNVVVAQNTNENAQHEMKRAQNNGMEQVSMDANVALGNIIQMLPHWENIGATLQPGTEPSDATRSSNFPPYNQLDQVAKALIALQATRQFQQSFVSPANQNPGTNDNFSHFTTLLHELGVLGQIQTNQTSVTSQFLAQAGNQNDSASSKPSQALQPPPSVPATGAMAVGSHANNKSNPAPPKPQKPKTVPCRARGLPPEHNAKTAFFTIKSSIRHGENLICSYAACREGGVKFRYCALCGIPVARRNFRMRHEHIGAVLPTGRFDRRQQVQLHRTSPSQPKVQEPGEKRDNDLSRSSPPNGTGKLRSASHEASSTTKKEKPAVETRPNDLLAEEQPSSVETVKESKAQRMGKDAQLEKEEFSSSLSSTSESARQYYKETGFQTTEDDGSSADKKPPPRKRRVKQKIGRSTNPSWQQEEHEQAATHIVSVDADVPSVARKEEMRQLVWASLLDERPPSDDDEMSCWLRRVLAVSDPVSPRLTGPWPRRQYFSQSESTSSISSEIDDDSGGSTSTEQEPRSCNAKTVSTSSDEDGVSCA